MYIHIYIYIYIYIYVTINLLLAQPAVLKLLSSLSWPRKFRFRPRYAWNRNDMNNDNDIDNNGVKEEVFEEEKGKD